MFLLFRIQYLSNLMTTGLNFLVNQISLGKKKIKPLTVLPIDLQYVSGKDQSGSVARIDLTDEATVDFLYS